MGDMLIVAPIIAISGAIALGLSYLYAWCSRRFAYPLVLLSVIMVVGGGFVLSWQLLLAAKRAKDSNAPDREKGMRGLGIGFAVFSAVSLLIVIALWKRILSVPTCTWNSSLSL